MIPPPPTSTLFPYTTLFRSLLIEVTVGRFLENGGHVRRNRIRPGVAVIAGIVAHQVAKIGHERSILRHRKERSEEHTSELQSPDHLVCRLLLEKKKRIKNNI